jgi:hypothetical protein
MVRNYEWLTPLSANFMPVSSSFSLVASSTPPLQSGPLGFLSSLLFSSFLSSSPSRIPSPSLGEDTITRSPFSLSLTPLFPTGMVQYDNKLECLFHRSHLVDDEKGLEEGLFDPSRGRYLLRLRYKQPPHGVFAEERREGLGASGERVVGVGVGVGVRRLMVVSDINHHKSLHVR